MFGNFNKGEDEIITCFDKHNEIKERFEKLWRILSNCFKYFSTKNLSDLKKFTKVFPFLFPERPLTRKMHVFSLVLPKYIRKYKIPCKILKLEQETEHLHHVLNGQQTNNSMFIPVRKNKTILV